MQLAVIPARGGSKRIPRKNIRDFAGKPMLAYAIEAAQRSGCFDAIVVSTDDEEIARIARRYGAQVPFMRPAELADDHTPTVPVIAHAIEQMALLGREPTHVCCIYPGCPLLEPGDLQEGLALLQGGAQAYAFPVLAFPAPIQRALRRHADGRTEPFYPQYTQTRSQDLEPAFHDAGQFYWGSAPAWRQGLDIHRNARTLVVPEWRAVDIDTPDDWLRAEALYQARQGLAGRTLP
jgi:pseudaminic acid cytidylyltransferase